MNKKILISLALIALMIVPACSKTEINSPKNTEITISAAASLHDALIDIKAEFIRTNKDISIVYNLGGSGALKQQLLQGAPSDLFISASKKDFNTVLNKGLIDAKQHRDLLSNELVLITNKRSTFLLNNFENLSNNNIKKIAIGTPAVVPAGLYAEQTLKSLHIWESIQSKLIQTKDVRQVLTYVESGNVDAGIVYMTDARVSNKVTVSATADQNSHEPIIYTAGVVKASTNKKAAAKFYQYLHSEHAKKIFKKYGFNVLD
jgi:molybdate transport system substrate-binding protein